MARRYREPDEHAQCGIRWTTCREAASTLGAPISWRAWEANCRSPRDRDRGSYWHNCHACGQALIYTTDRNAKPQVCKASTA